MKDELVVHKLIVTDRTRYSNNQTILVMLNEADKHDILLGSTISIGTPQQDYDKYFSHISELSEEFYALKPLHEVLTEFKGNFHWIVKHLNVFKMPIDDDGILEFVGRRLVLRGELNGEPETVLVFDSNNVSMFWLLNEVSKAFDLDESQTFNIVNDCFI